jgi:hypothetical protein
MCLVRERDEYVWYAENSGDMTHPAGLSKLNLWGLCMGGRIWRRQVYCGGGWYDTAGICRLADRNSFGPCYRHNVPGFAFSEICSHVSFTTDASTLHSNVYQPAMPEG